MTIFRIRIKLLDFTAHTTHQVFENNLRV